MDLKQLLQREIKLPKSIRSIPEQLYLLAEIYFSSFEIGQRIRERRPYPLATGVWIACNLMLLLFLPVMAYGLAVGDGMRPTHLMQSWQPALLLPVAFNVTLVSFLVVLNCTSWYFERAVGLKNLFMMASLAMVPWATGLIIGVLGFYMAVSARVNELRSVPGLLAVEADVPLGGLWAYGALCFTLFIWFTGSVWSICSFVAILMGFFSHDVQPTASLNH